MFSLKFRVTGATSSPRWSQHFVAAGRMVISGNARGLMQEHRM